MIIFPFVYYSQGQQVYQSRFFPFDHHQRTMSLEGKPVEVVQQDTDSSPPRSIDEPKEYDEHLDAFGFNVDEFKAQLGVDKNSTDYRALI